jgi:hypothetical protein
MGARRAHLPFVAPDGVVDRACRDRLAYGAEHVRDVAKQFLRLLGAHCAIEYPAQKPHDHAVGFHEVVGAGQHEEIFDRDPGPLAVNGAQISIEPTILRPAREILEGLHPVCLEADGEAAGGLRPEDSVAWRGGATVVEHLDGESFGADRLDLADEVADLGLNPRVREGIRWTMERQVVSACVPRDERLHRLVARADREHGVKDAQRHAGVAKLGTSLRDTG